MGSKEKFFSISSQSKGFNDIGVGEPSGVVSAVAQAAAFTGRTDWANKIALTVTNSILIQVGQPINILLLDSVYNGLTRVLAKVGTTRIIVDINYSTVPSDVTGTWDSLGGAGAWDAFQPIGADLTGANLALTFFDPKLQSGTQTLPTVYTKDVIYACPGIIKTALVSTAGVVRLIKYATTKPWGKS